MRERVREGERERQLLDLYIFNVPECARFCSYFRVRLKLRLNAREQYYRLAFSCA
jgi:hypothetical protein